MKYVQIAVLAILLGAGAYGVWSYRNMATKVAELAPLKDQVAALQEQAQKLSTEMIRRADLDAAIRGARQSVNSNLDKVTHENPAARSYLDEPVPDGVREAYLASDTGRQPVPAADADRRQVPVAAPAHAGSVIDHP